ncbi:MAG: hypothetical protein ACOQNV_01935 [Mycoplasmoidaceae bacterium]
MAPWEQFIAELTDKWGWLIVVSTIACVAFLVMTVSQFIKILWTKNTTSQSLQCVIMLPVTNTLITIYDIILAVAAIKNNNPYWGLLIPAIINGLISAYGVMITKIIHMRTAKKLRISEREHFEKYLKPKSLAVRYKNKKK